MDSNKIWCKIFKEKYLKNCSMLYDTCKPGDSPTLKWIAKVTNELREGFSLHPGSGEKSFWYDNWIGCGELCTIVDFVNISDTLMRVKDLWRDQF
ncbi:hypothetical protein Lalb_Chr01g0022681 [Lupinus albus]|uniref:Reverse transcriptase zinc-binding domain-containing protein n=1 Tax=Lupinus albus TaxID=3870 RepID=A0A6A4R9J0_LUPAL|nr:hypothetical protein Lalb_Chr01g0022681 [Lupinus albus]